MSKRSVSPPEMTDSTEPEAKQVKRSTTPPGPPPPNSETPSSDPTSSTTPTREHLPPVSPTAEAQGEEEPLEQEEEEKRKEGIKIEELNPIRFMYDEKSLQGWPEDEQDQVEYPYSQEFNEKVYIWRGDITKLEIDCIVNAANKSLLGGGGVDGAIHSASGPKLYEACKLLNGAKTGETKLTFGFKLPAKHVAHTVGPIYSRAKKEQCEEELRSCYRGTLELCVEQGIRSVAFSGISTGVYGYPIDNAAAVACDEVRKFLESEDGGKIDQIIFCNFRQVDVNSYLDNLPSYFPPPPPSSSNDESISAAQNAPEQEGAAESTKEKKDSEPKKEVEEGENDQPKKKDGLKRSNSKASPRKQGKETHSGPSSSSQKM